MASISLPVFHRHARGRKAPKNLHHLRALAFARNGEIVRQFPPAPELAFDSRALGFVPPVKDQAQCGSCWDFSGVGTCEIALIKAGLLKADGTQALSEEYVLSCLNNGGCNGDDNTTVLIAAKANGLPFTHDYGPYNAGDGTPGQCAYNPGMTMTKIQDWGFADSNGGQGVTPVQDIKEAIKATGCVGCAVAAGSDWDNAGSGTTINGDSTNIDHDVILVGWDDNHDNGDRTKGAWIMRNSWGSGWADNGYAWIKYGADSIGTEAVFALVGPGPGPVPPGPVPPGPTPPPVPPVPVPTGNMNITLTGSVQGPFGHHPVTLTGTATPQMQGSLATGTGTPSIIAILADLSAIGNDLMGVPWSQLETDVAQLLTDLGLIHMMRRRGRAGTAPAVPFSTFFADMMAILVAWQTGNLIAVEQAVAKLLADLGL